MTALRQHIPHRTRPRLRALGLALSILLLTLASLSPALHAKVEQNNPTPAHDDRAAAAAFRAIVPVLHHPRCMNCHSNGDYPRQGDDSHPHTMQIRRGPDGHGANGIECGSCHQDHNLPGNHMPPGAPEWHLPSPQMPMIWEGLTDHQLCELFKDPRQNGGRSVREIVAHMHTPLVLWGWAPGNGRNPVPMSQKLFLHYVSEWASAGAACPAN